MIVMDQSANWQIGEFQTGPIVLNQDDLDKQATEHAWSWFALHAGQRLQCFNFSLVASAFLMAAYAALLEKHPGAALVVGLAGAWISVWFNRLDRRTRQIINAAEAALEVAQARLAARTDNEALKILEKVRSSEPGASSYRVVIAVVQRTVTSVFLLALLYAAWSMCTRW